VQIREVPVEGAQVPALDEQVDASAEHDRAKAVPLRLVEEIAGGKGLGELRQHRLDGRVDRKRPALLRYAHYGVLCLVWRSGILIW
jgi:hypothetical protein